MELPNKQEDRVRIEAFQKRHRTGLVTLLFTDIVGSTRIKSDLGEKKGYEVIRRHHELIRGVLKDFAGGEEIKTSGDSFFIAFVRPSDAVRFSVIVHMRLRGLSEELNVQILIRTGIHIGEVFVEESNKDRQGIDLYGIQVDTCARVMSLCQGGQILVTRSTFDNARQVLKGQDIEGVTSLSWLNHGPYSLKGIEEPLEICEVGEVVHAFLKPPPDSENVHRFVSPDSEPVLGWRPALGQEVPGTQWTLEEKLGEGGFGEVWLGRHTALKQRRVFKFCFREDRVRSLKREVTLFRLLRERLEDHRNIVAVEDVYLKEAPYYLTMEYVPGRDLKSWIESQGGIEKVSFNLRLEIAAQIADALQAAHDAGVIHRDVKPSNILVREVLESGRGRNRETSDSSDFVDKTIEVKLADFGIGQVVSDEVLRGMTRLGFTQTLVSPGRDAQAGTYLYLAPELFGGKAASPRSDIYSLGVILYQLIVGDFSRPITTDWTQDVEDVSLREDLAKCTAGDPQKRFPRAGELARNLRDWEKRRLGRELDESRKRAEEEAQQRQQAEEHNRELQAAYNEVQRHLYIANMHLAQQAWEGNSYRYLRQLLEEIATYPERGFEYYYWQRQIHRDLKTFRGHLSGVASVAFSPDGERIVSVDTQGTAKVWEADSGRELHALKESAHKMLSVMAVATDGRRIFTSTQDRTAKVYDLESGNELLLMGVRGPFLYAQFSRDGQRIATTEQDGSDFQDTTKVWDSTSGEEIVSLQRVGRLACISPDGQRIVTSNPLSITDATLTVWDTATGAELANVPGSASMDKCPFSPDGRRIVVRSAEDHAAQGVAKVCEVEAGKELLTLKGHTQMITSAEFSPDGKYIITGSCDQTAKVWDAESGRELLTIRGHCDMIQSVGFSPDGRRIVTGSADRTVKVWEFSIGRDLLTFDGQSLRMGALSRDGKSIVTAGEDSGAKLWDTSSGRELLTFEGHAKEFRGLAFSPDGRLVAGVSPDDTGTVWEATSGRELLSLKGVDGSRGLVSFAPDGQRILTGGCDVPAKVYNTADGRDILVLRGHKRGVLAAACSPNGQQIATGGYDKTVKIWDARTGAELHMFKGHGTTVIGIEYSQDGQRVATWDLDLTAKVWNVASGEELLTAEGIPTGVAFSPDGHRVGMGCIHDRTARILETATGREVFKLEGHTGLISSIAFSPDGQRIATGGEDQIAKLWDMASGDELFTIRGHSNQIFFVAFSPDGQKIVTGSADCTVKVLDTATGKELLTLTGHREAILFVAFSPDGRKIVSGSADHTVKLWDAVNGRELLTLQAHDKPIIFVAVSLDGERIVTCDADRIAKVWEAMSGRELLSLKEAAVSPNCERIVTSPVRPPVKLWDAVSGREQLFLGHGSNGADYSPDGGRIVTSNGQTAKVWDARSGNELLTLKGESNHISPIFSPDGQKILTLGGFPAKPALVWNAETGEELFKLEGHTQSILSGAFSPNGKRIVTGGADQTAKLWEAESGRELLTLRWDGFKISFVGFTPNGRQILTGCRDGKLKFWDAATNEQVAVWQGEEKATTERLRTL